MRLPTSCEDSRPTEGKPLRPGWRKPSETIRETIRTRGITAYRLAKLTGLGIPVVQRFLNGERDITLATADRLALALGLSLEESCPTDIDASTPSGV